MDLYYFNITPLRNKINYINNLEKISINRQQKVTRLKQNDDKLRCIGAGILEKYIGEKYKVNSNIIIDRHGKPFYENNPIYFNISHSGNYVVAVVSDDNVGVDIQRVIKDKHRVAQKQFLEAECEFVNQGTDENEQMERFCQIWTAKEAYLKNIGIGLRKSLKSFQVVINSEELYIKDEQVKLTQLKLDSNYIITICSNKKDIDLNIEEIKI